MGISDFLRRKRSQKTQPMNVDESEREGYHRLPGTLQSPTPARPVDKTHWQTCGSCSRYIPVIEDRVLQPDGTLANAGTCTYVCPFCSHCHVGTPDTWSGDAEAQARCHNCDTELGDSYQCPKCSFPRGWMRVNCPYCGNSQPVYAPHWVVGCDTFHLECVKCESAFVSLCIC
jgi:hypothetical protein